MTGHLFPGDADWAEVKALLANLSHLNPEITRYVLRQLDADAKRAEPIPSQDEHDFGQRLIELGTQGQQRAARRQPQPGRLVIEGNPEPRSLEPSREPGMDHGP
jgi:hypothetical protein